MKITLGTVSFGIAYGVANDFQQVSGHTAQNIIKFALANGIRSFDTATSYGNAERILGNGLTGSRDSQVMTKLSRSECTSAKNIVATVHASLEKLSLPKMRAVLLHDVSALHGEHQSEVKAGLVQVLDMGLASSVGVSTYSEAEVLLAKEEFPQLTIFQLPENVCDRRALNSKDLISLAADGNEFHVRSLFLQGLLLMNPENLPEMLKNAKEEIEVFHNYLREKSFTAMDLCVGYGKSIPWATSLVLGVNTLEQLDQITKSFLHEFSADYSEVPKLNERWLDPRAWS